MDTDAYSEDRLFILDFDDTLIPSSWLKSKGVHVTCSSCEEFTPEMVAVCERVGQHAAALINAIKKYGKIVIVTNATRSWLELSTKTFMPSISDLILSIPIISAADLYEYYSSNSTTWKKIAFQNDALRIAFTIKPPMCTVISIGDGEAERQALKYIHSLAPADSMRTKSIKFMDNPSPELLAKQLATTLQQLHMVVTRPESLDLQMIPAEDKERPAPHFFVPVSIIPAAAPPPPPPPPLPPSPPPSPPPKIPRISSVFEPFSMFEDHFISTRSENKN